MGQGSGSVTTFSRADGFATIDRHQEIVQAGTVIDVQLLGRDLQLADLVVIGSHCIGLDYLLGELQRQGLRTKFLAVGSTGGLEAARRGECDVAGVHLLDPATDEYNRPFLTPALELVPGYGRLQGIVFRRGDLRFEGRAAADAVAAACGRSRLRDGQPQPGQRHARAHRSAARPAQGPPATPCSPATTTPSPRRWSQGRADWGVTLETVARAAGLGFLPVQAGAVRLRRAAARAPGGPAVARLHDAAAATGNTGGAGTRLGMTP